MSRVDLEEQVRYRRKMNARHRQIASVAQSKVVQWLNGLDEKAITRMSAADATRLLDVAVRIERMATCAVGAEDLPDPYGEPARENGLEQRLVDAGLDVDMSQIARLLHEKLGPAVGVSEPQAQDRPAPIPPLETPPDEETPPESVWGDRWQPGVDQQGGVR
jgi:hypothetical protein